MGDGGGVRTRFPRTLRDREPDERQEIIEALGRLDPEWDEARRPHVKALSAVNGHYQDELQSLVLRAKQAGLRPVDIARAISPGTTWQSVVHIIRGAEQRATAAVYGLIREARVQAKMAELGVGEDEAFELVIADEVAARRPN